MAPQGQRERPRPPSEETRARMVSQSRRDTSPELAIRRELHRRGLRYRVDVQPLAKGRGRADVVFSTPKVAVYVDGCFWHRCPEHGTIPRANRDWWLEKLDANFERDRRVERELAQAGWLVIRVWEHEDPIEAADRIQASVQARTG